MFDFVRKHNRLFLFLILVLILPSFVVFGIQGYSGMTEGANAAVAKVDGQKHHPGRVGRRRTSSRPSGCASSCPTIDPKLLDSPEARAQTLDALVRERVLAVASDKLHLAVSDERLQRLFVNDPQFALLRNADNSINKDLLAAQGMSVAGFEAAPAPGPVAAAGAGWHHRLGAGRRRAGQRRRWTRCCSAARSSCSASSAQGLPGQGQAHRRRDRGLLQGATRPMFRAPEQASIEYVVLDLAVLKKGVAVPEEDLRKYYTENASRYTAAEERRARHILIQAAKDAPADVRQKAKAKAEALLAEARKNPAGFADLAKKNSDDPGSAPNGGDLDFFGRGAMVKPFEDAAFAMKPGEISNVVESRLRLPHHPAGGRARWREEAVRGGARRPSRTRCASRAPARRWAEAAEQFTNMVYEQSDSLQPVIDTPKHGSSPWHVTFSSPAAWCPRLARALPRPPSARFCRRAAIRCGCASSTPT